jgi:hypothetical protein
VALRQDPSSALSKLPLFDGNAPHLIGTAGNELWATGEWSDTGQGETGGSLPR